VADTELDPVRDVRWQEKRDLGNLAACGMDPRAMALC
jgi:hypothetical protein